MPLGLQVIGFLIETPDAFALSSWLMQARSLSIGVPGTPFFERLRAGMTSTEQRMRYIDAFNHSFPSAIRSAAGDPGGREGSWQARARHSGVVRSRFAAAHRRFFREFMQILSPTACPDGTAVGSGKIAGDGENRRTTALATRGQTSQALCWLVGPVADECAGCRRERKPNARCKNGANAVQIATNANGIPLDAPEFLPIFEVIAKSVSRSCCIPRAPARCPTTRQRNSPSTKSAAFLVGLTRRA